MSSSLCVSQQDDTAESSCQLKIYPDGRMLYTGNLEHLALPEHVF